LEETAEEIRRNGYAILNTNNKLLDLAELSTSFDLLYKHYVEKWGEARLARLNELYTVRMPLIQNSSCFIKVALNQKLLELISLLIRGKFILTQQNGIINPPLKEYNQGSWHRDLPYQHFVSDSPIAINALLCVDDFTVENGSTFVIPGSHKCRNFPTSSFVEKNAVQVIAPAGSYIILDCMTYHSGGRNRSNLARRAINHVFTIPFFKQQINIFRSLNTINLSENEKSILGFHFQEPDSIEEYFQMIEEKQALQRT
jgi:ectoine hydroxylase-related dioxygenase (phytanoyl-CoA dioxygenase family)